MGAKQDTEIGKTSKFGACLIEQYNDTLSCKR